MPSLSEISPTAHPIAYVGLATMFFGFGAGALLNLYLKQQASPMLDRLRGSLDYKSSIIGDGLVLPVVNMLVASFLLAEWSSITQRELALAAVLGVMVTLYFHITQAVRGLVNWCMPTPWHWNWLGAFHALYMFTVASLLALFYLTVAVVGYERRSLPREAVFATLGILCFLWLLRIDYATVSLRSLLPRRFLGN
ncbi:MAG: hypothetical protein EXR68_01570 [Dehalococcoidia bacterium]|nr:hypothetical protein [Dehalococcoidia bacterium]